MDRIIDALLFKNIASRIYDDPDLFNPLWINVTLAFIVSVIANIVSYLYYTETGEFHFNYRLVQQAFTMIFGLGLLVPSLIIVFFFIFGFTPSWKSGIGIISIYNYSNIFFIFGAIAHIFPLKLAGFIIMCIFAGLSVIFLLTNYARFIDKYPENRKKFILIFIVVFQALALLAYKLVFFN